jgi:PHS family inorganic phosphate transporter-like MFS transporter
MGLGSNHSTGTLGVFYHMHAIIIYTLIMVSTSLIPGHLAAFLAIDSWGRKPLQLMGFIVLSILFLVMGSYHQPFTIQIN